MRILSRNWFIFLIIIVVFFTRLLILNKDATDFSADEWRYRILITKLEESKQNNDFTIAIKTIFRLNGRPGLGLFYYPAAFLEWKNPNIPFGTYYNLVINFFVVVMIYLIVKKIQGKNAAILAILLVNFSIASVVDMRHLLPYDIALLLLLTGCYLYVSLKKSFIFGLFIGFSFLTYPSFYYYLLPIPIILVCLRRSLRPALMFVIGVGLVLMFTNLFSLFLGETTSYFHSLQDESGGVTAIQHGDYMPAFSFIGEYIINIDGVWNLFIILTAIILMFFQKKEKKIIILSAYLICVFILMELYSHILSTHVLYARTVKPFYLFLIVFAALLFEKVFEKRFKSNKKIYFLSLSIIILLTFLNWIPRFIIYKNLIYPKQFQQKAKDYLNSKYEQYEVEEDAMLVNYWNTDNPDPKLIKHFFKTPGEKGKFYIMNAVQTFPYYGNLKMDIFCDFEVLLKEPHIQYIFRPYLFEGHNSIMRERMEKDPLFYQLIYCKI